ncbi:MAG TPA: hydroxymethylbilane synthase, partial [Burkholderiales bacterium]|nr:hydroxymethylbilane synthase [Burkholderiales bacterium]
MNRLVIATRASRLALWQAGHVKERLEALHPGTRVELLPMTTSGDQLIDRRLDQAGGKGLFVKELETAMADGRADLAVHSMKDVPADLPPGFTLAAITAREDPRDALLSNRYRALADMPPGAVLGTSSLRRAAQVSERYPRLEVRLLRGNVETRIAKLDRGDYDAIVLAVAGLVRLGLAARITARLAIEESLPAPGQGALGIECLAARSDVIGALAPLADPSTAQCVRAERAVSRALGGSCALPLGAYAVMAAGRLELRALIASPDGRRVLRTQATGPDPEEVGARAAQALRAQGA